jgi:glyoxylase-like metal-dependent hydrolase (beta-lactamase superfamily II)
VRAVALHNDVLVATSAIWQTNCVVVREGEECFLIDSPILPEELDALPALVERARFPTPSGLLATHGDWDHLLGRLAFTASPLACAETTAARLQGALGEAQRELRAFDEKFLIARRRPLALGRVQALPVPGLCGIGARELELHRADGHAEDGMAISIPWASVLATGDYLSAVEIPSLATAGGSADAYLATLARLRTLVQMSGHVVPGHGPVLDAARALKILEEDLTYLAALTEQGIRAELPANRRSKAQTLVHERNVAQVLS